MQNYKEFLRYANLFAKYSKTRIKLREKNEGTAYDAGLMDKGTGITSPTNGQNRKSTAGKQPVTPASQAGQ